MHLPGSISTVFLARFSYIFMSAELPARAAHENGAAGEQRHLFGMSGSDFMPAAAHSLLGLPQTRTRTHMRENNIYLLYRRSNFSFIVGALGAAKTNVICNVNAMPVSSPFHLCCRLLTILQRRRCIDGAGIIGVAYQ